MASKNGSGRLSAGDSWQEIDRYVQGFEKAWQRGSRPRIEDFLPEEGPLRRPVLIELVHVDQERRRVAGEPASAEEYRQRFPELAEDVPATAGPNTDVRPPLPPPAFEAAAGPQQIGRYFVERVLGQGGFGLVYLARDSLLSRQVAIKVPHPKLMIRPEDAEPYLAEARLVAGLDHPNIVPVHDMGQTPEFPCFVVYKFIAGRTLSQRIKQDRLLVREAAELIATLAKTLHYAHRKGLVHRDIKPGNILLEEQPEEGKPLIPYVADFGLALREKDFGKTAGIVGTPLYMSPEQARGEGHRVDGRSDIFSLGVVFYELLTGVRPFRADTRDEVLERIRNADVRPPRQHDDTIPKELERICLKALARRATDRYTTAKDLADDLDAFLEQSRQDENQRPGAHPAGHEPLTPGPATPAGPLTSGKPIRIVPKGLRSFGTHDADFFLELLPGPRDRDGLPESIRFWKTRIEEKDQDSTFAVGLIYGPSGCGKSSLVKAGLLPLLSPDVISVYVEATAGDTEARLLNGLRKHCPPLGANLNLKERLAGLRRGEGLGPRQKVLVVLDQFEQWLHAHQDGEETELVQALRQCDGQRVQCVIMVRDDFWLAVSRFLKDLESRLIEGQNSAMCDLFGVDHARRVLAAFGRAFGRLPDGPQELTLPQKQFLEQAVEGLAEDGKVICVRLALFAEMMKDKPWTPASLKAVGGAAGVGVNFLEETFSAPTAPPEHRHYQKAARAVLQALLPEAGAAIKGHMKSHQELLEVSAYAGRPQDFDDLRRILDRELRLISPTDPEGVEESGSQVRAGGQYYQLTHDYLVPALREWLTRKQKETRRGRAELLLADQTAVWLARTQNRQLPTLLQWAQIRTLTRRARWTSPQRKMMKRAALYHGFHVLAGLVLVLVLGYVGWEVNGYFNALALKKRLLSASTPHVLAIVGEMAPYRRWVEPLVQDALVQAQENGQEQKELFCRLALLPGYSDQVDPLCERMLSADVQEVLVIREALRDHHTRIDQHLWDEVENANISPGQRLRAACALASFAPGDKRWQDSGSAVAGMLVAQDSYALLQWAEAFRPVRRALLPTLADFLEDETRNVVQRGLIAGVYGSLAIDVPEAITRLESGLEGDPQADRATPDTVAQAKKQASDAVALVLMGHPEKVWRLLEHRPDPTCRSLLIERLGAVKADADLLSARLQKESNPSIQRALVLTLGGYEPKHLTEAQKHRLVSYLQRLYREDADPGIHGVAGWLLRERLNAGDIVSKIDADLATGNPEGKHQWYINSERQTLTIVPTPTGFWSNDGKRRRWIPVERRFAIAAKEVTVEQFFRMVKDKERPAWSKVEIRGYNEKISPGDRYAMNGVSWYAAAAYCNWLSKKDNIDEKEWCYIPNAKGEYADGMKLAPNYLQRHRVPFANRR